MGVKRPKISHQGKFVDMVLFFIYADIKYGFCISIYSNLARIDRGSIGRGSVRLLPMKLFSPIPTLRKGRDLAYTHLFSSDKGRHQGSLLTEDFRARYTSIYPAGGTK